MSCGVFVLKVCDIFLRGGTWEKIKSDYSIVLISFCTFRLRSALSQVTIEHSMSLLTR